MVESEKPVVFMQCFMEEHGLICLSGTSCLTKADVVQITVGRKNIINPFFRCGSEHL